MELVNTFLAVPLLTGVIFLLVGFIMKVAPPRKINSLYGYRTSSSMKSQERWDFAQKYSAIELMKAGGILIITSALGFVIESTDDTELIIGLGLLVAVIAILFLKVEKAIKSRFPE